MPKTDQSKVLLIEDDEEDYLTLRDLLGQVSVGSYRLERVANYHEGQQALERQVHDIYLVDNYLGDGEGLNLLALAQENGFQAPMIILTGQGDWEVETRAIKAGAADYLVKGQFDAQLLERSLRFAIERARLRAELEEARQREERQREFHSLERLSALSPTIITGQAFGLGPLRQSEPSLFADLVGQYGNSLEQALEQRAYRVEHNLSEKMRLLAEQLGLLCSGPRDVVEIHTAALQAKSNGTPPEKAQAYAEEGRLLLLQLMGHLASFYRMYYPGGR